MRGSRAVSAAVLLSALSLGAQTPAKTPAPAGADHHDRKPEDQFTVKALGHDVYALFGRGGNVGFYVAPDSVTVIDSEFKDVAPGIVSEIRKVTDKPIRFLINTHWHGDHTGGNEVFRQFAMILAHDNVRERMLASPQMILRDYPARVEHARKAGDEGMAAYFEGQIAWAKTVKIEEIAAPTLTFDSEFRIHTAAGETIHVWHLPPSHTDGDSAIYFENARVLHMGDDYFNRIIPFVDIASGGSLRGYLAAIDKVIGRVPADVAVIPGHGEVSDLAGLKAFRQYVVDVLDTGAKARALGKSREQFLKEVDLPAYKDFMGYKDRFKDNAADAFDEAPAP